VTSWLFLLLSLCGAWLTWNVFRPTYAPGRRAVLSFVTGWLTSELALHHTAFQLLVTLCFAAAGAFGKTPGRVGLLISLVSWTALVLDYLRGERAAAAIEGALAAGLGHDYRQRIRPEIAATLEPGIDWTELLVPVRLRHVDVERTRDVVYQRVRGLDLRLDVYRPRSRATGCPVLLEIHGGGWVLGSKNDQGLPMMLRMAARGWVCISANYRLSPHATFPDHLIDLKRALAWIREHVAEFGGDPDFVVAAGQSAGGHLASLVALTANDPSYQRGFEQVDTSVAACISYYGVYDFTDRHLLWPNPELAKLLEEKVMKASLAEDREAYEKASPMSRIHEQAPPFLIIHGDRDSLVPVAEARRFAADLRAKSRTEVCYAEIPGAQHAFDIFRSLRGEHVLFGVERFLGVVYSDWLASRAGGEIATATGAVG
jgi:acetyl esterase/lipase